MTLVVAHRTPYGVRLCSDMRVVRPGAAHPQGFLGATLKVVILRPRLCIAFAGEIGAAIDAIRRVDATLGSEVDVELTERLLLDTHLASLRSRHGVSFIAAGLHPTTLTSIRDGVAHSDLSSAWIGDRAAFELFQEGYVGEAAVPRQYSDALEGGMSPELANTIRNARAEQLSKLADFFADEPGYGEDLAVATHSHAAMRAVVESSLETVGEAAIFIAPRPPPDPQFFGYLEESSAFVEQGLNHPEAGSAGLGGFSSAILTPREPGIAAVGVYFLEGRLGLLHHPLQCDGPVSCRDVNVEGFKNAVQQEFGFSPVGIGIGAPE